MAKKSMIAREDKRKKLVKKYDVKRKSLKEIIDKLKELGLSLNMNVSQFLEGDRPNTEDIFLEKMKVESKLR